MITKIRKTIMVSLVCCAVAAVLTGCNDYLDAENTKENPYTKVLTSLEALQGTTASLYTESWYYFHKKRYVLFGDCRANNMFNSSTSINEVNAAITFNDFRVTSGVSTAWGSLYNVVAQSGYVINDYVPYCIENGICSEKDARVCEGEARFMTALAYYFIGIYWHDAPIVADASRATLDMYCNRFEDIMQYAILNAEKAAVQLPDAPYQKGRVTNASAQALLSRLYITQAAYAKGGNFRNGFKTEVLDRFYASDADYASASSLDVFFYTKAEKAAKAALANSRYGLMDDYEQIFRVQNNNCKEVFFALQFPAGINTSGLGNDMSAWTCPAHCINNSFGKDGDTYSTFASYDFLVNAIARGGFSRNKANVFISGTTYDYLFHEMSGEWNERTFGCNQADHVYHAAWKVRPGDNLSIKKQQVGGDYATDGVAVRGNSGFATPMIRYSEVLLNLAEAMMGKSGVSQTSDATILGYVNQVRQRAYRMERKGLSTATYPGDYATVNMDSLLIERRMEFFMEGLYWGDIVRRSFMSDADLQRMLDYNNNKLYENEGNVMMGAHRDVKYRYTMADTSKDADGNYHYDQTKMGKIELRTNSDGSLMCIMNPRQCEHKIAPDSYCHSSALGEADNLWSTIYPPTEVTQNPNLIQAPVPFDFSIF